MKKIIEIVANKINAINKKLSALKKKAEWTRKLRSITEVESVLSGGSLRIAWIKIIFFTNGKYNNEQYVILTFKKGRVLGERVIFTFRNGSFKHEESFEVALEIQKKHIAFLSEGLGIVINMSPDVTGLWGALHRKKNRDISIWSENKEWGYYINADGKKHVMDITHLFSNCIKRFPQQISWLYFKVDGKRYQYGVPWD